MAKLAANSARKQRPKPGATIDDRAVLAKLIKSMSRSPELGATTALRAMGIADRATIRRVSGKYNKLDAATRNSAKASAKNVRARKPKTAKATPASMAAQPLLNQTPKVKRSANSKKAARANKPAAPKTAPATEQSSGSDKARTGKPAAAMNSANAMQPWLGTGLDLSTAAFRSQLDFYQQVMKMAPVKTMLQQQMQFSQAMLSLFSPPKKTPRRK